MKSTLTTCLVILSAVAFVSASNIKQQPVPAWIAPVAIPSLSGMDEKDVTDGYHYLLYDEQLHVEKKMDYSHLSIQIVNDIGVQNSSEIELTYDPGYQQLMIHYIRVVRNGKTIDKLELKDIKDIQQEKDLDNRIYDGRHTAYISLKDIRKGDLLDYAYTIVGRNPILGDHYSGDFSTEFSMPITKVHYAVFCDQSRKLNTRQHITSFPLKQRVSNRSNVYEWTFTQPRGKDVEDYLPDWFSAYGFIEVSDFNTWSEVVDWALPIYSANHQSAPELEAKIKELNTGNIEHKILGALHFVQDEIRYMGFEVGINSHKPNAPNRVFSQRFGDCKDKANLLCHMLSAMGIEAYPNLVNSSNTRAVAEWLPSPLCFNHVTVCVIYRGQRYWLDPTNSYQGGLLHTIQYPDYGKTLLIKRGEESLSDIRTNRICKTSVYETFVVNDTIKPITLRVITTYFGTEADRMRYQFSASSLADVEHEYTDFYKGVYGDVTMESRVETSDDKDKNIFKVFEEYAIRDAWEIQDSFSRGKFFAVTPQSLFGLIHKAEIKRRKFPYSLTFPFDCTQIIEVKFPHAVRIYPEKGEITDEHFNYSYDYRNEGQNSIVLLKYHFNTLKDVVVPDKSFDYFTKIESVKKLNYFNIPWESSGNMPSFSFGAINHMMLLFAILLAIALSIVAIFLYKIDFPNRQHRELFGKPIGGWLIFLGIALCMSFPLRLFDLVNNRYLSMTRWEELTTPGAAGYHPLWGTLTVVQLSFPIISIVMVVFLISLYTSRRSSFPKFFIGYVLLRAFFALVNLIIAYSMPAEKTLVPVDAFGQIGQALVSIAVWIPYLVTSTRVRDTFIYTYRRQNHPILAKKPVEPTENDAV